MTSPLYSFISLIKSIIGSLTAYSELLLFRFNTSKELLDFNKKVLENFGYDMKKLIPAFKNNIISPGSEF